MLKMVLQLLSAWPAVASLAYLHRGLVIAYLHLVLLGCISLLLIALIIKAYAVHINELIEKGIALFFVAFACLETILIAYPIAQLAGYGIPYYANILLFVSCFLPIGIFMFSWPIIRRKSKSVPLVIFNRESRLADIL
jgi:hypothetical protein